MTKQHPLPKVAKDERDLVTEEDIVRDYMVTQNVMIGSEIEHMVFTRNNGLITSAEHKTLKEKLYAAGVHTTDEPPACIFEVKSHPANNPETIIAEMTETNGLFEAVIVEAGYKPVRTGYIGHTDLADAIAHRMPFERSDGLIEHFMSSGNPMRARTPLMTSSVHVSISFSDIEHAYDIGKILMVLTPALVALCEQTEGIFDGKPCSFNPSATVRLSHQPTHAGLSTSLSEATDPEDMIRRHVRHIFNTPMMMHMDEAGDMQIVDRDGKQPSLNDLAVRGLNTRSNAMLAESMQYHMLKLTSLRDGEGRMTGKRLELRMADNGPFQHDFMVLLAAAIALDGGFRNSLESHLTAIGLNPHKRATAEFATAALDAVARDRRGAGNVPFGSAATKWVGNEFNQLKVVDVARILCTGMRQRYGFRSGNGFRIARKTVADAERKIGLLEKIPFP